MKAVIVEEKIFQDILSGIDELSSLFDKVFDKNPVKNSEVWMDTSDVCMALGISMRSVRTLRKSGKLPYTIIEKKHYYKPHDILRLIIKR